MTIPSMIHTFLTMLHRCLSCLVRCQLVFRTWRSNRTICNGKFDTANNKLAIFSNIKIYLGIWESSMEENYQYQQSKRYRSVCQCLQKTYVWLELNLFYSLMSRDCNIISTVVLALTLPKVNALLCLKYYLYQRLSCYMVYYTSFSSTLDNSWYTSVKLIQPTWWNTSVHLQVYNCYNHDFFFIQICSI